MYFNLFHYEYFWGQYFSACPEESNLILCKNEDNAASRDLSNKCDMNSCGSLNSFVLLMWWKTIRKSMPLIKNGQSTDNDFFQNMFSGEGWINLFFSPGIFSSTIKKKQSNNWVHSDTKHLNWSCFDNFFFFIHFQILIIPAALSCMYWTETSMQAAQHLSATDQTILLQ